MTSTQLDYAIAANPFPLIASPTAGGSNTATLNLIASNLTDSPISIQSVTLTLLVGADDTDLTGDSQGIQPQAPTNWTALDPQYPPGQVQFSFTPNDPSGSATVAPSASLTFALARVTLNQRPGTTIVTVTEGSDDCQPPGCPTQTLEVTKFPSDWGGASSTVSFVADPPIIAANDPSSKTTLKWSGPAGATYTIEYWTPQTDIVQVPAPGQPALGHTGEYPADGTGLELGQTTTFYLTVTDTVDEQIYSAQYPLSVTVEATQQLGITVGGSSTAIALGDTLTLSWETQLADSCSLEVDEGSGSVTLSATNGVTNTCQVTSSDGVTLVFSAADGSALGNITLQGQPAKATFRFTASLQSSNTQQTFAVDLLPAVINEFRYGMGGFGTPDPYYLLMWQVSSAASVSIEPFIGSVVNRNYQIVSDDQTYTLTAQGFGVAVSAKQAVPPLPG